MAEEPETPAALYIHFERPIAFAGVWTARKPDDVNWEINFAIVTTGARGIVETIHERMPLVMDPRSYAAWLNPATVEPKSLLMPFDDGRLEARLVSTLVNDPRNDSPACMEPST